MVDYDILAGKYVQHRQVHPEVLKRLIKDGHISKLSTVLEVGCGSGNYIRAIQNLVGPACRGIDPSLEMITHAQNQSREVVFQQGKADYLPFEDEFFDLVFSVDVVHHLKQIPEYFSEAHRVLKHGGMICTVTDTEEIIRTRRPLAFYFPETIDVDIARYPSVLTLRAHLLKAGFKKTQQVMVEYRYILTDIQAYRDKAFSCLHLISQSAFARGIQRMEQDLEKGPIQANSRYTLLWGIKKARITYF